MDYSAELAEVSVEQQYVAGGAVQPLDASCIDPGALEDWQKNFHWPISDLAFREFAVAVAECFMTAVAEAKSPDSSLLLSDLGFVGFLMQHLHLNAARVAFEAKNERPVIGAITTSYVYPDWEKLGCVYDRPTGGLAALKLRLRGLAKTWILNRHLPLGKRLAALRPGCATWVLGSFTPLITEYAGTANMPARYVHPEYLLRRRPNLAPPDGTLLSQAHAILVKIEDASKKWLGVGLDFAAALESWGQRLSELSRIAAGVRCRRRPQRLLLSNMGNPYHRLMALTWRDAGTQIVGLHHGNEMGVEPNFLTGITDFSLCDRFVTPTKKCAEWFRWIHAAGPTCGETEFASAETERYRDLRKSVHAALPEKIRRVMIVGFPLSWIRYPAHAAHFALLQLDLELRLVRFLKDHGFEVILKVHPEWQTLSDEIWQGRVDRQPREVFENCWQDADAVLFPRISSTTFGHALCTNRPIIVFDPADNRWNPEAYALLKRRCRMVPATMDSDNRQRFDGNALLKALADPVAAPDDSYVRTAMYPKSAATTA